METEAKDRMQNVPPANSQRHRRRWWLSAIAAIALGGIVYFGLSWRHASQTESYFNLCRQAAATDDWQTLGKVAASWRQSDPDNVDAAIFLAEFKSHQGLLDEAIQILSSLPDQNEKTPAALLIAVDLIFKELNQPRRAIGLLERLKKIAPEITGVRQRLIFFYALTLQRRTLIEEVQQAIADNAEPPDAYVYLILASHLTFTNGPQLNAMWSQGAPDDLDYQAAYLAQMADALATTDSPSDEKADRLSRIRAEIESLSGEHPAHEVLLADQLFWAARDDDVGRVGELLNTVTADGWKNSLFWRYRGWFHHRNGELAEAHAAYSKARDIFPLDWQTWQGLAEVQRMQGNLDDAERSQQIALEGKELRRHLLQLPDVSNIDLDTLHRIGLYADHCGDRQVSDAISARLAAMNYSQPMAD